MTRSSLQKTLARGGRQLERQCRATKANGERCKGTATGPRDLCWAHAPENSEQRRRTASRGGRGKPSREIRDLKKQLDDLAEDVLGGRVERSDAAVVNQILNTRARLIELERRVKEADELEARLALLEQDSESRRGGPWGA
jgi:hypothetical protein